MKKNENKWEYRIAISFGRSTYSSETAITDNEAGENCKTWAIPSSNVYFALVTVSLSDGKNIRDHLSSTRFPKYSR